MYCQQCYSFIQENPISQWYSRFKSFMPVLASMIQWWILSIVVNAYFIGAHGKEVHRKLKSMTPPSYWPELLIGTSITEGFAAIQGNVILVFGEWAVLEMKLKWSGDGWKLQATFLLLHFLQNQTRFNNMLNTGWWSWLQLHWLCRHSLNSLAGMLDLWKMWLESLMNQRWTFIFSNEKEYIN